ncbi:ABC transporter permease [Paenibacillus piri]|uniref:Sugar ABC transporter permease n=1 Tax=Paenibacillus piri TaxID=2547395 RepID=A0A4R5KIV7_9BACL|nr:ABC transporter permease subunit [Paenibacillus piri]TDF95421.1 sugar ABC transporter permease [Paenibacillus piri]
MKATAADSLKNAPAPTAGTRRFRQNIPLLLMFAPVVVYFVIIKYAPMAGLLIAFKDYSLREGIWGSEWVGLANFRLLFDNPQLLNILRNTLLLSLLNIVAGFPVPIILAILLNEVRQMQFRKAVQTLVYLPHFFSWIIVGGFVVTMFSMENGIVNRIALALFGETKAFLYEPQSWIAIFVGSAIWKEAGFGAIVYLAALSSIDPSLYEAASIDGAGKARKIWHVTLPGIRPTIILMLILSMGRVMEVGFDHIYVLQNQVVTSISEVISTYIYKVGLGQGMYSITTALGLFESVIGLILVWTSNQVARRFDQSLW